MARYHCDYCGVYFDEPMTVTFREIVAERTMTYAEERCPVCGCSSFSGAKDCPKCGRPMPADDVLCDVCRADLKARVLAFADTLTAEEEEQLDGWLDGDTITSRRHWT